MQNGFQILSSELSDSILFDPDESVLLIQQLPAFRVASEWLGPLNRMLGCVSTFILAARGIGKLGHTFDSYTGHIEMSFGDALRQDNQALIVDQADEDNDRVIVGAINGDSLAVRAQVDCLEIPNQPAAPSAWEQLLATGLILEREGFNCDRHHMRYRNEPAAVLDAYFQMLVLLELAGIAQMLTDQPERTFYPKFYIIDIEAVLTAGKSVVVSCGPPETSFLDGAQRISSQVSIDRQVVCSADLHFGHLADA